MPGQGCLSAPEWQGVVLGAWSKMGTVFSAAPPPLCRGSFAFPPSPGAVALSMLWIGPWYVLGIAIPQPRKHCKIQSYQRSSSGKTVRKETYS